MALCGVRWLPSVLVVLMCTACTGPAAPAATPAPPTGSTPAAPTPAPAPEPDDVAQVSAEQCAPAPGRQVTELPDVEIDELVVGEVRTSGTVVDGGTVPGVLVPGYTLPRQVADAGCEIEHDAPAGCLPAIEISAARLPGRLVPERVVPERRLPDGRVVPAQVVPAQQTEAQVLPGQRAGQVCQVEREGASVVGSVVRKSLVRASLVRRSLVQGSATSRTECVPGGCIAGYVVPGVVVPGVVLSGHVMAGAVLAGRVLDRAPDVDVLTGDGTTAFVAPGDLLFDTGSSTLRREARASIDAIARRLRELPPSADVTVEGHTDDVGADADNQALSERRAAAVADRLVAEGIGRERITTRGLGETAPASPGTSAPARRANRRVVVGVRH